MRPGTTKMLRDAAEAASNLAEEVANRLDSTRTTPAAALLAMLCLAARANLALGDDALTDDEMLGMMRSCRDTFQADIIAELPPAFRA